ncbi:hypothetical protein PV325_012804 [Microctonus aethiopoides]|nr:hypothetical protein PV325_012804 [Microctonus aethiopoides]KAK0072248.1 hypothetical protein PV326_000253 [Microctonus aethiopoides]
MNIEPMTIWEIMMIVNDTHGEEKSGKPVINQQSLNKITPLLNNLDNTDTTFNIGIQQQYAIYVTIEESASGQRPANQRSGRLNLNCRSQSAPFGNVKKTTEGSRRRRRRQDSRSGHFDFT